jgi:L-2-hydroxyglutarate oxidase LhgO
LSYDVAIVGGGIIGLATGHALVQRLPGVGLVVLEKEPRVGEHQTGHNSGVLHSGLYYAPGSMKADLCVRGAERMVAFCEANGVPWDRNGKLVVATRREELPRLDELERRGTANGVLGMRRIGPAEIREIEPHATGLEALHVPTTGTIDFGGVARALARLLAEGGVDVLSSAGVRGVAWETGGIRLLHDSGDCSARVVVNCAGLHSDRLAEMMGVRPPVRIVPFRGEYLTLRPEARHTVRSAIYPVPNPELPFLGVHLTRRVGGVVEAGPNAVLAFAREGYRRSTVRPSELLDSIRYPGTRRLLARHWRNAAGEFGRSLSRAAFVRAVRRLVPDLDTSDFEKRRHSGVRAQALRPDGGLVDDFVIETTDTAIHVLNAPSPGATSSLAIGEHIAVMVAARL